jgi:hypothetical protein
MALHLTPSEHREDPPSGWTVRRQGRKWALCNKDGHVLDTAETKTKAESLKTSGFVFELYCKEGRWFRGESVANWKPYQPLVDAS